MFFFPLREIQVVHCASPMSHICIYFPDVNPQVQMVILSRIQNSKEMVHLILELWSDLRGALTQPESLCTVAVATLEEFSGSVCQN